MSIVRVVADIDCDECGKRYHTLLDEGADSVFDAAVNGKKYSPKSKEYAEGGPFVSYEDGKMFCPVCTSIRDQEP